jgi:general secretion pathway protein I
MQVQPRSSIQKASQHQPVHECRNAPAEQQQDSHMMRGSIESLHGSSHRLRAHGFTLLEVLVALAVVSIALGAAITTGYRHTQHLNEQRDRSYAHWLAVDVLNAWRLGLQEDGGSSDVAVAQDVGGRKYHWVLRRLGSEDDAVMRAEVTVHAVDEKGPVVASEVGYRAVPAKVVAPVQGQAPPDEPAPPPVEVPPGEEEGGPR